ncbi:MAG: thioredoxin [Acidiferrobacterales bacterium]
MSTSPYVADVTHVEFDTLVLARSRTTPVLVDFWASWCAPCKMLMPVLARLADEYQGKFHLAKVNTDIEQALATRYGIRSLPTVKLFKDGVVVDEFLGVQPEKAIREIIDRHAPRPSDALLRDALRVLESGQTRQAAEILERALDIEPANDRVMMELARLLLADGRLEDVERTLDSLSRGARSEPAALTMLAHLEIAHIAAGSPAPDELERTIAGKPADSDARYQLSAHKVMQGDYESALALLLAIVRNDRRYRDDAARKMMLTIFALLDGKGDLVKRYRNQLSMALN